MDFSNKTLLVSLLAAACAVAGAFYAQRVINENKARTAAQQTAASMTGNASPDGRQGGVAPATPPAQ